MNYKVPGLISIFVMFMALGIADYELFTGSLLLGAVYMLCIPLVFLNTLYHYCSQCPHADHNTCRHVIFGPIVAKLFKPEAPAPYKPAQILGALIPLAALVIFPQAWLWQNTPLFVLFWVFMMLAGMIVRVGVCPRCENSNCSFCPRRTQ